MNTERLMLAATVAMLLRGYSPTTPETAKKMIKQAVGLIAEYNLQDAIDAVAGDEPVFEKPLMDINMKESTGSYQTLAEITVPAGKMGRVSKIEMACNDYDQGRFKLTINDEVKFTDLQLPNALTLDFLGASIRSGLGIKLEGKADDASAFNMWGDVSGKEES